MANWWDSAPKASPMDLAIAAENVDPKLADIARSVYMQESGGGRNTKTSNAGAVGGMQIIRPTFDSVADKGWDINDPVHNARAGVRYLAKLYEQAGGDPALTAAGYYGGPGGLEKARRGIAVSDPRNPKAPTTLEYGKQVASRLLNAAVPSANAATGEGDWWSAAPVVEASAPKVQPSTEALKPARGIGGQLADAASGVLQGVGETVAGAGQALGRGYVSLVNAVAPESQYAQDISRNAAQTDAAISSGIKDFEQGAGASAGGQVGRFVGNVAATLPVGGLAGKGATVAARIGSGALAGGIAGSMQPVTGGDFWAEKAAQAGTGALIGGALPAIGAGARATGRALGFGQGAVSPEVAQLAQRAKQLGIDVRADQLVNSKPMNAASAALDYVPFSGKGTAIATQQKQFNTAISKTIGENTDNVAQAVKNAETRLGSEFDRVLKNTAVKADTSFQNDLVRIMGDAQNEMTEQQLGVLSKQINNILNKVQTGDVIDADAAYNIKKGLDRVAKSNDSTLAYYARDTRNALMDALNRSLPDGGKSFAQTRKQWGNLMELNKLLPRGAEGDISAARLGNARNIRSQDLGELADIGAQFIKGRVGDSGTAQRAGVYGLLGAGTMLDPVSAGVGLTVGRGLNSVMNSNALTQRLINNSLAPLNSNAALAGQAVPGALVNRLAPYLVPAASTAGVSALNKP